MQTLYGLKTREKFLKRVPKNNYFEIYLSLPELNFNAE